MDIIAESVDGSTLLVGECKWSDKKINTAQLVDQLNKPIFTAQEVIDSFKIK